MGLHYKRDSVIDIAPLGKKKSKKKAKAFLEIGRPIASRVLNIYFSAEVINVTFYQCGGSRSMKYP